MKKFLLLVIAAFAMVLTSACQEQEVHNSLEGFLSALQKNEFVRATGYVTEDFEMTAKGMILTRDILMIMDKLQFDGNLSCNDIIELVKMDMKSENKEMSADEEKTFRLLWAMSSEEDRNKLKQKIREEFIAAGGSGLTEADVENEMLAIKQGSCKIDGNTATVTYRLENGTGIFTLIKQDDRWLIQKYTEQ